MGKLCPVCSKEYEQNVTMCDTCGFSDRLGIKIKFAGMDWLLLDKQDRKVLLLSEITIEQRAYNEQNVPIAWASCTLRQYLNEAFYAKFSPADKVQIAETSIITPNNPWFGTKGGEVVYDKIFLLSIEEVVRYFGDSGQLKNRNPESEYWINDQYNASRVADCGNSASCWWLRSPGFSDTMAAAVHTEGWLLVRGNDVDYNEGDVRPALWLNLTGTASQ